MKETFSVGNVLSASFSLYGKNFLPIFLIGVIAAFPSAISALFSIERPFLSLGLSLLSLPLTIMVQGFLVFGIHQYLCGEKMSLGQSTTRALRAFFPILGASLLVALMTGIGFVFLIIPGIVITCVYWIVIPAIVVENDGIGSGLTRSKELTQDNRMSIFGIIWIVGIITGFGSVLSMIVNGAIPGMSGNPLVQIPILRVCINLGISGLSTGLYVTVVTVAYFSLRQVKDGLSAESLAAIFD